MDKSRLYREMKYPIVAYLSPAWPNATKRSHITDDHVVAPKKSKQKYDDSRAGCIKRYCAAEEGCYDHVLDWSN